MTTDPRQVEPERAEPGPIGATGAPYDPLRLCIFATIALLGWILGPVALVFFAGLGFVGYWKSRRAGLLRSRCLLGDTANVLVYLGALALIGVAGVALAVSSGTLWKVW